MKKIMTALLLYVFISGCAGLTVAEEENKPLAARVYSSLGGVKDSAIKEYQQLVSTAKSGVLEETVGYLRAEGDSKRRASILEALKTMNDDGTLIYPLILAVSKEISARDTADLIIMIENSTPAPSEDLVKIKGLLKNRDAVHVLVLAALGRMGRNASSSAPDIVEFMHDNVADKGLYVASADALYKIDQTFAVSILSIDAKDGAIEVRKAAVEKMIDINKYMEKNLPATKQAAQAIMSVIFSADEVLSESARKAVESSGDEELLKEYDKTMAAGRTAISGLIKFVGSTLQVAFKAHEKASFERVISFYEIAGRPDAAGKMKKEMKRRGLDKK